MCDAVASARCAFVGNTSVQCRNAKSWGGRHDCSIFCCGSGDFVAYFCGKYSTDSRGVAVKESIRAISGA